MPIYEFNCEDCNKDSEILVRSSEWKGHAKCPSCGSVKLEKKAFRIRRINFRRFFCGNSSLFRDAK